MNTYFRNGKLELDSKLFRKKHHELRKIIRQ